MLELKKLITRDWSLMFCENLHKVNVEEFNKQFGWSFTEIIFEGRENFVVVYRSPEEEKIGLTNFILKKLDEDPSWLNRQAETVENQTDSIEYLIKKIKEHLSDYSKNELAGLLENIFANYKTFHTRYIIMKYFPTNMEQHPLYKKYESAINKAIETRTKLDRIEPPVDKLFREIASEVLKRAGLQVSLARFLSFEEALNYLREEKKIDDAMLLKRKEKFIITNAGILFEPLESYIARKNIKLLNEEVAAEILEVRGNTAYPGKAKGYAKIIYNEEMFQKFKEGDILITPMTAANYTSLIDKAAAIITDEGGITCHAAIVSREMKKPCLVGTKFATKIFKDNDLIEVDAEKGIAKKII